MAVFEWQEKASLHFGRGWVPIVVAHFRSASGRYRKLKMVVDSGAIVSLVRSSFAEELGITLESGRHVSLTGVLGRRNDAFLHELTVRFGDDEPLDILPIAISVRDDIPNLLGRLGVFDRRRIEFDPLTRTTRIDLPQA